ncbi:MAG: hypothetical protein VXX86_04355, partial [Planctomycetota bacterium]|nr:hypothetical protein [Planctomycetota bacterium]
MAADKTDVFRFIWCIDQPATQDTIRRATWHEHGHLNITKIEAEGFHRVAEAPCAIRLVLLGLIDRKLPEIAHVLLVLRVGPG